LSTPWGAECTAADLKLGTAVAEAELEVEGGIAVFETVALDD